MTPAKDLETAVKIICAVENCPELAIVSIHIKAIK
jgi:hypothetical protein